MSERVELAVRYVVSRQKLYKLPRWSMRMHCRAVNLRKKPALVYIFIAKSDFFVLLLRSIMLQHFHKIRRYRYFADALLGLGSFTRRRFAGELVIARFNRDKAFVKIDMPPFERGQFRLWYNNAKTKNAVESGLSGFSIILFQHYTIKNRG